MSSLDTQPPANEKRCYISNFDTWLRVVYVSGWMRTSVVDCHIECIPCKKMNWLITGKPMGWKTPDFYETLFNDSYVCCIMLIHVALKSHVRQHGGYWWPGIGTCQVTHICVGKLTIIGSDNDLSPERRQAIIWTNAGILLIGPLGTNFSGILIKIHIFSFKKMHLKMSSGKRWPFCLGLKVLNNDFFVVVDKIFFYIDKL